MIKPIQVSPVVCSTAPIPAHVLLRKMESAYNAKTAELDIANATIANLKHQIRILKDTKNVK